MCFAFLPFTKNSKFGLTFIQGRWHWILSHSPLVIWRGTPVISGGTPGGSKINYFIYWVFIICHVSQNVVSPDLEIQGNLSYNEYWCHCRSAGQLDIYILNKLLSIVSRAWGQFKIQIMIKFSLIFCILKSDSIYLNVPVYECTNILFKCPGGWC